MVKTVCPVLVGFLLNTLMLHCCLFAVFFLSTLLTLILFYRLCFCVYGYEKTFPVGLYMHQRLAL